MAIRLFSLCGVSSEEADQIRNLLFKKNINFYETPTGNWGRSMAAIWLTDESQLSIAKKVLDEYHADRLRKSKTEVTRNDNSSNGFEFLRNYIYGSFLIVLVVIFFTIFL